MKILFFLLVSSIVSVGCVLDETKAIDTPYNVVCCQTVYLETLDPLTGAIDYDIQFSKDYQCKSVGLDAKTVVDDSLCP